MIASTLELARHAREEGYAVPAVNVFDHASMRGAMDAAVSTSSPLIVQVSVKTLRHLGLDLVTTMFRLAAASVTVPISLHLDHCPDVEVAKSVIRAGWSSLLLDVSDLPLEDAIDRTAEIVRLAHEAGVDVESEVENILGVEDGVGSDEARHAYSVDTLADVAERTGADLLAPQLGTAHGMYHERPRLRPDRAAELARRTGLPVVLHGGTGLEAADFRSFIEAGVAKINISTAVKRTYLAAVRASVGDEGVGEPLSMFVAATRAVEGEVARHMALFGSAGHAEAALLKQVGT